MGKTVFIVDEIKAIVEKTSTDLLAKGFAYPVYYTYGHPLEVERKLQELTLSPTEKNKKFPLVVLVTDVPINRNILGFYGSANLRILICNYTEPTYTSEQRTDINFKPILHPIKEQFLLNLRRHKQFTFESVPTFVETDCYYYGSLINDKTQTNDRIDLIELSNLQVNITEKIC